MGAYKDKSKGTWMAKFSYVDWQGKNRWTTKRGFATKREALEYEMNFKLAKAGNVEMSFASFVARYRSEVYPRIKLSTQTTKDNIIETHILPFFGNKKIDEITTIDVIMWQNNLLAYRDTNGKAFSRSYLKTIHNQLSALLNYARKHYGLKENVAEIVGNMGTDKEVEIDFWTREEYDIFIEEATAYPEYYYAFQVLYWTGIREGELLALTPADINLEQATLTINKTYQIIKGKEYITDPKTRKSNRIVSIPAFLVEELREYMGMIYDIQDTDRLFMLSKNSLLRKLKNIAKKAGVKPIRVHDLRHSHISLLIELGFSVVAIGDRVGHESSVITFRYAHMFPSTQMEMAEKLNELK